MDFRSAWYRDALREAHLILAANSGAKDIANFLPALEYLSPSDRQTVLSHADSVMLIEIIDQNLVVPVTIGKLRQLHTRQWIQLVGHERIRGATLLQC